MRTGELISTNKPDDDERDDGAPGREQPLRHDPHAPLRTVSERTFHSRDPLTNLPTRSIFVDELWRAIEITKRRPCEAFTVLLIGLDQFKTVNDRYGRIAGDRVLAEVAIRLGAAMRPSDVLARLEDDEFAILLERVSDVDSACRIAARALAEVARPFDLPEGDVALSASIGITLATANSEDPLNVLREAGMARHRAKAAGGGRYAIFDLSVHERAIRHLTIENELRLALERGELAAFYQPIYALDTTSVVGFEALVRWNHPERGLILPDAFIAIAEESDLVHAVDEWVLREACRQLVDWRRRFAAAADLTVSVNLSSKDFRRPDLADRVALAIASAGLEPHRLRLEITETALLEDSASAARALAAMGALGVKLLIDDFGVGYSSLSYLHRFPFDSLKLDRSFVSGADAPAARSAEIVRAVVQLAHTLGLDVVAEGIESEAELVALRHIGCEYGQGYYFLPPVDAHRAESLFV